MKYAQVIDAQLEKLEKERISLLSFRENLANFFVAAEAIAKNPNFSGNVAVEVMVDINNLLGVDLPAPDCGGSQPEEPAPISENASASAAAPDKELSPDPQFEPGNLVIVRQENLPVRYWRIEEFFDGHFLLKDLTNPLLTFAASPEKLEKVDPPQITNQGFTVLRLLKDFELTGGDVVSQNPDTISIFKIYDVKMTPKGGSLKRQLLIADVSPGHSHTQTWQWEESCYPFGVEGGCLILDWPKGGIEEVEPEAEPSDASDESEFLEESEEQEFDEDDRYPDALAAAEIEAEKKTTEMNSSGSTSLSNPDKYITLTFLSPSVAYQRKHDGQIICGYLAATTKALAKEWAELLEMRDRCQCEVRKAKRMLVAVKDLWEVKIKNCSIQVLEKLAKSYQVGDERYQIGDLVQINFPDNHLDKKKGEITNGGNGWWAVNIGEKSYSLKTSQLTLIERAFEPQAGDLVAIETREGKWQVEEVHSQFITCKNLDTGDIQTGVTRGRITLIDRPSEPSPLSPMDVIGERLLVDAGEFGDEFYFGFKTVAEQRKFEMWLRSSILPVGKIISHSSAYQFDCWQWKYSVEVECEDIDTVIQLLTYFEDSAEAQGWKESVKKPLEKTKYRSPDDYKYNVFTNLDLVFSTDDLSEAEAKFGQLIGGKGVFQVKVYEKEKPFDPIKIWKIEQQKVTA